MTMNGLNIDYSADTSLSPPRRLCGLSVTQKIIQFNSVLFVPTTVTSRPLMSCLYTVVYGCCCF